MKNTKPMEINKSYPMLVTGLTLLALLFSPGMMGAVSHAGNTDPLMQLIVKPGNGLSDAEEAGLIFMREEEKVARDVYAVFSGMWQVQVFGNITQSEQTHMDAILTLLDWYNLPDPAAGLAFGEFDNPDLQNLYNVLVDYGSTSVIDALFVGCVIEEVDIIDLIHNLDETDHADIEIVYNNLLRGSENHLRAFVRNLANQGITYEPVLLDPEYYNSIING